VALSSHSSYQLRLFIHNGDLCHEN
jgi:hypothetical protein